MKARLIAALAAAIIAVALVRAPNAQAHTAISVAVAIPGGVAFDVNSGGYCDRWGCPVAYWGYPVWYGPTYCAGAWYDGPVYYQSWGGARYYWVHGGWCPNQWVGPYPVWWSGNFYFGPALSFTWYQSSGFIISTRTYAYYQSLGGNRANWTTVAHQQFTTAATHGRLASRTVSGRTLATHGVARTARTPTGHVARTTRTATGHVARTTRTATGHATVDRSHQRTRPSVTASDRGKTVRSSHSRENHVTTTRSHRVSYSPKTRSTRGSPLGHHSMGPGPFGPQGREFGPGPPSGSRGPESGGGRHAPSREGRHGGHGG